MLWSKNKKKYIYPCIPQFCYIKMGFKGVFIARTCFPDAYLVYNMSDPDSYIEAGAIKSAFGATDSIAIINAKCLGLIYKASDQSCSRNVILRIEDRLEFSLHQDNMSMKCIPHFNPTFT